MQNKLQKILIEHQNIPIPTLASQPPLYNQIITLFHNAACDPTFLSLTPYTFRQLFALDKEERISNQLMDQINALLEDADKNSPIYLEDQYPLLKQPTWEIPMTAISYYSVTLTFDNQEYIRIEKIKKLINQSTNIIILEFQLKDPLILPESQGIKTDDKYKYPLNCKSESEVQTIMKQLILNGQLYIGENETQFTI